MFKLILISLSIFVGSNLLVFAQSNQSSQTSRTVDKSSVVKDAVKIETVPMSEITILKLENLQLRMELLKRDIQDLASNACVAANLTRESCRINSASGTISGEKIASNGK